MAAPRPPAAAPAFMGIIILFHFPTREDADAAIEIMVRDLATEQYRCRVNIRLDTNNQVGGSVWRLELFVPTPPTRAHREIIESLTAEYYDYQCGIMCAPHLYK